VVMFSYHAMHIRSVLWRLSGGLYPPITCY